MPVRPPKNQLIFTKNDLISNFKGSIPALNEQIKRALKSGKLLQLKNGSYMSTELYFAQHDKIKFTEFLASRLCTPSYISLSYVLHKYQMLAKNEDSQDTIGIIHDHSVPSTSSPNRSHTREDQATITCITTKSPRIFRNALTTFRYTNLKKSLYYGFHEHTYNGHAYHVATKAKAFFDYLYLKPNLQYRNQRKLKYNLFTAIHLNLTNFSEKDFEEFESYVWKSNCKKMMRIRHCLEAYFSNKKFDLWAKELLKE